MKVIIDFYNSHWSEKYYAVDMKVIPRVGEFVYLESPFEEHLMGEKWEVKAIEHTFEDGEQLIKLFLI